jgi:hypothetical protein
MTIRAALRWPVATAVACLLGCVDTSPIVYTAPADAGGSDAAASTDGALIAECRKCMTTGACKDVTDACTKDSKCNIMEQCLLDDYCLNFSVIDISNLPPCLSSCGHEAQITGVSDPSNQLITPVLLCAQSATQCGSACDPPHDQ